jgi:hypothetical protein
LISAQLFDTIIMSSSTFAWWAAVLSKASNILFPIAEDHYWSVCYKQTKPDIDLRIDEARFTYFYNCPTIRSNRISPQLISTADVDSKISSFHKKSKALWYE